MPGIRIDVDTTSSFTNVKNLSKALSDLGKQGIVTESEIKKLTAEFQKKLAAEEAERKAAALGNTLDRVAKSCGMTAGQLADLRTKAGLAASSMAELNQSITLVHSSVSQSTANFANTGNSVDVLVGKVGLLAAGYISLQSAMQAVKSIASMESLRASFAGIFGDNGAEQFKYVIDAANKYGKSIEDTAGAYRKFAAAADYVGMSTENIRKIFEGTSQAITKVGGSSQDVAGALLAISQSIGKGQVMSEEFRQQFAERIPGAMKMAANAMGVTTGEFQKLMEAGQVLPNEFWPKMADEMSKFSQGWQASSQTLVSDFERMKNALMELGGNDVVQGVAKVLGFFTLGTVEESARRITSIFDDFSTKYKAIQAEMSGQLSPFEAWYTPIDELKKKLDDIAAKRSEYIAGLKTDVDSLTKSLADAQSKQLDFGPSGENVDVMRQKLKWFQDLLVQLTGQTWTVNVNANVDMSQLKQAQSYIQEVIKGTSEVKSRTIDAEREKLDNAVKILGKNKSDLEAQLASPTTDTWQKGSIGDQLKTINKDLDDAKLGYNELTKQQKKLTEQQVKDNSEVKRFNESRGGVSGSEVTHDTQRIDAERLSIARQTDAWREYQAGLKTLPETYEVVSRAQEAESVTQDKITKAIERESKSRSSGATAAARYAERTFSYLEQAQDQYDQLVAMMGGDTLAAKIAGIEKRYDKAASAIRQAMIGAKGSTAELDATLEKMGQSKALEILMAQADAWRKSMQDAANLLGEIGRLSGDPSAIYGSEMTTAKLWEADQQKRINAIEDETEREKQLGELRQAMALKEVAARADAYESVKAVSSKYWEAERQLIEAHLGVVKANADDELAYKIYAAQQWDEYNKKQIEQQAQTAGTFADTFAARWSLHFGSYKDEMTKTKESWDQMSDSIINSTDGMIDGVASGFGDMIRNIGNGTASIEDLWKNMLSRMLDAFASFVENLIKQQLQNLVSGWFSGPSQQPSEVSPTAGGIGSITGGIGSSSSYKEIGKGLASGVLSSWSSGSSEATAFLDSLSKSNSSAVSDIFKTHNISGWSFADGSVASGSDISSAIGASGSSVLSTVGGVLGVVGGVAGLIGIVSSLFGEKKEEIKKVASGYNVQYAYGKTVTSGVDFYSDGSVVGTGVGDPDVTRKISKAFKDAAENLQDFADTLGFTVDVLDNFQMPSMNITDSQLDTYIRNGSNAMAFQALEQAGLRGAFDALAEDGEVYIDEFARLNDAYQVGANKLSAYGYNMAAVAQITDEQIAALREQTIETAAGTSQAILAMAQSMGATSDQMAILSANASDGSQALSVTNEQLEKLLTADWVSKVEDQVGGEDAFNSIMDNLIKNVFNSIDAYAENLGYYNQMASKYISQLSDDSVTVENFWGKFNEALKNGLDPEQFELWGNASTWVNSINAVNDALADWNEGMNQLYSTLDARAQEAAGVSKTQIAVNQQIATAEKELYDARKANYDAAYLATLQEVQNAELERKRYEAAKEQRTTIEALIVREMKASNSPWTDAVSAQYQNRWEYQEAASSGLYSAEQLARLKAVQAKEVQALFDSVAESFEKNATDAKSRLLRAVGNTDEADLYDKQVAVANELKEALKSNLYTAEAYADLVAATSAEVQNLIEQQARDAAKYASDIQVRYLTVSGKAYDAAILTKQVAAEQELFEARQKGLAGTETYAQLEQVLAMEIADLIAQQTREQESYRAGLQARILTAQGYEYEANEVTAMAAAEAELADARAKGYDAATLALLAEAQAAEAAKRVADQIQKIRSDWASLESRLAIANGDNLHGNWTAYKSTQEQEMYDALSGGKDQAYIDKLKQVQQAEAVAKWKELIEDAVNDIKDKLNEVVSKFKDAMDSFNSLLETQISATSSLANNAESVHKSLQSTIKSITVGDDSVLTGAQKAQSLSGQINTAYQQMLSAGHGQGRIDAASTLESLSQDYLSALQSSSNSEQYLQGYLDTISKLKEAQSITGQEENYQTRLLDLMEAEKNILELINKELSKQTPDIEKLKALQNTSGMLGGYIQGLYNNDEATINSWQKSVVSLLSEAGFSGEDITSALNGSSMTSFLDAMNEFNHTTLPTYFEDILSYLAKIAEAGEYTPPDPGDGYTDTEKNWASNLAVAMNAQHYGGSAAWSQASVLKNLATYAAWGNNYGISSTQGYSAPKSNDKQYYYGAADLLNAKNGETRTWLDIQNDVTSLSGSGNYLAHWLQYGFSDNIKFPSGDAVMKKTADYFEKKWKNEPSLSASPLTLAHDIADIMGLRFDNSAATLEYIAKKHYDTWIKGKPIEQLEPSDWGLVQPYALGGVAPAGTLALVGEYGPELMNIGSTSAITPHNATLNVLGDAYADSTAQLKAEIRELRRQNEMLYAAVREIVVNTKKSKDVIEKGDAIGFPVRTVS